MYLISVLLIELVHKRKKILKLIHIFLVHAGISEDMVVRFVVQEIRFQQLDTCYFFYLKFSFLNDISLSMYDQVTFAMLPLKTILYYLNIFIAIMFGMMIYKLESVAFRMRKMTSNCFILFFGLLVILLILTFRVGSTKLISVESLFNDFNTVVACHKVLVTISVGVLIILCHFGALDNAQTFLSSYGFRVFSRLTYSVSCFMFFVLNNIFLMDCKRKVNKKCL